MINPKQLVKGVLSYFPPGRPLSYRPGGEAVSARYCYSVWLRHLAMAYKNGVSTIPDVVAEFGPGDSLGIGMAALLSGANKYYALDVVDNYNSKKNAEFFEQLFSYALDIFDVKGFGGIIPS